MSFVENKFVKTTVSPYPAAVIITDHKIKESRFQISVAR